MPDSIIDLAAIEERVQAATEGPWDVRASCNWACPPSRNEIWCLSIRNEDNGRLTVADIHKYCRSGHVADCNAQSWTGSAQACRNAEFISHARTDIPRLLAEVKVLRDELAEAHEQLAAERKRYEELEAEAMMLGNALDWLYRQNVMASRSSVRECLRKTLADCELTYGARRRRQDEQEGCPPS